MKKGNTNKPKTVKFNQALRKHVSILEEDRILCYHHDSANIIGKKWMKI